MNPLVRSLIWFWVLLLSVLGSGAAVLQLLGPPSTHVANPAQARVADRPPEDLPRAGAGPGRSIAAPDPALLEAVLGAPGGGLPRIAADGRRPMDVYSGASPADRQAGGPRVALLLAGMGLSAQDSEDAIRSLPAAITLAFNPYAPNPETLLQAAREHRHEIVLSLPMEPAGAPLNDAGNQALLSGASAEQNARRLAWSLSRIAGYAGVSGGLGAMRGQRLSALPDAIGPVLRDLASRGLYFIDGRETDAENREPRGVMYAPGRMLDLVIDEQPTRTEFDRQLARLEMIARQRGTALGYVGAPLPTSIGRIAVWAAGLNARGITLVPVSALTLPAAELATAARP